MPSGNGEGFVEELDESAEILGTDVYVLPDEDGNDKNYALLAIVEIEGQDYAMFTPLEELQAVDEDGGEIELIILEYFVNEDGDEVLSTIEDDDRYEEVRVFCTTLIAEETEETEAHT